MSVDLIARAVAVQARARTSRIAATREVLGRSIARSGQRLPVLATVLPTMPAASTTSAITGTIWKPSDANVPNLHDKLYTFLRDEWVQLSNSIFADVLFSPLPNPATTGTITRSAGAYSSSTAPLIRFYTEAPDFEIMTQVPGGPLSEVYRLRVDGDYVKTGTIGFLAGSVGGYLYQRVTWPDRRMRLYEVECIGGVHFGGIKTPPQYRPMPAPQSEGLRGIVHGDSFVDGAMSSETTLLPSMAATIPLLLGQADVSGSGSGGTGFIGNNGGQSQTFNQRVQHDIIARKPDFIIEVGGANDGPAVQPAVESWLASVTGALPDVFIAMTGPLVSATPQPSTLLVRDAKKAAAAKFASNVVFIDNIAESWAHGTGRVGAPTGDGNADYIRSTDNVHPSPDGHVYLAQRIVQGVAKALSGAS